MIETALRESPLVRFGSEPRLGVSERLTVSERPFLGNLNLRGSPRSQPFSRACNSGLGYSLPRKPNTSAANQDSAAFWLGPEEWLILTPPDQQGGLAARLETALGGRHFALNDVSAGHTVVALSGEAAPEVIRRGCGIDVHAKAFKVGHCAQTAFARTGLLLSKWSGSPSFELVIRRSFADYLWLWLTHIVRAV